MTGFAFGDIIMRPRVGVPLVVIDEHTLDDGSGEGGWIFFNDPTYRKIGSVFTNPSLLFSQLALYSKSFNAAFYEQRKDAP